MGLVSRCLVISFLAHNGKPIAIFIGDMITRAMVIFSL